MKCGGLLAQVRRDIAGDHSPDGEDPQRAVRADGLDHEADFVGVGVQLDDGTVAAVFLPADVYVPHPVDGHFPDRFRVRPDHVNDFVLKTGHPAGVGDRREHFKSLFFLHSVIPAISKEIF